MSVPRSSRRRSPHRLTPRGVVVALLAAAVAAAGCGGKAVGTAGAAPSGPTPYVGFVDARAATLGMSAGFFPTASVPVAGLTRLAPAASIATLCASPATVVGSCCYSPVPPEPPTLPDGVAAGTLTVSLGGNPVVAIDADSQGQYSNLGDGTNSQLLDWKPGDVLHIGASGGVIDAFTAPLQTPGAWSTTPGTQGGVVVDRSKDFVQTWTPDAYAGETVGFYLVTDPGAAVINCQATDASGQLTVPAALLASVPVGAGVITNVYRSANTTVTAGNVTVYLSASSLVTWTGSVP